MSEQKETFPVKLICGFCGQFRDREFPVKLDRGFKLMRWCDRCAIKGDNGERVRLCSRYLQSHGLSAFTDAPMPAEILTVKSAKRWQHGTHVTVVEYPTRTYDLADFAPADYAPTDAQRVREKLITLGAKYKGTIGLCADALFTAWLLDDLGIIFAFNGESAGLYDFVGEHGAPVETDVQYLEKRHADRLALRKGVE